MSSLPVLPTAKLLSFTIETALKRKQNIW